VRFIRTLGLFAVVGVTKVGVTGAVTDGATLFLPQKVIEKLRILKIIVNSLKFVIFQNF